MINNNMKLWKMTLDLLKQWEHLGVFKSENGSLAIGHVPQLGQYYYLHTLLAPLNSQRLCKMEQSIGRTLPNITRSFYQIANGFSLFRNLDCYGHIYEKDQLGQPISIRYGNVVEVPTGLPVDAVVIGSIEVRPPIDFAYLVALSNNKIVLLPDTNTFSPIEGWDNIFEMIYSEVKRIAPFFNENGICEEENLFLRD